MTDEERPGAAVRRAGRRARSVTGAASGLGFAIAEVLAECGAHVTLADVDAERLEACDAALADAG